MKKIFTLCALVFAMVANAGIRTISLDSSSNIKEILGADSLTIDSLKVNGFLSHANLSTITQMTNIALKYIDFSGCDFENNTLPYRGLNPTPFAIRDDIGWKTRLRHVVFPESLDVIESQAMIACVYLTTLQLPGHVSKIEPFALADLWCLGDELVVPQGLTTIKRSAFARMSAMRHLSLPSGIEEIENDAFSEMNELKELNLPEGLKRIGSNAFSGLECMEHDIVFPESLEELGDYSFNGLANYGFAQIKVIFKPGCKIKSIPDNCFYYSRIVGVEFSDGIEEIMQSAFESTEISDLYLPASLHVIDERAFCDNRSLRRVVLPETTVLIGNDAFKECPLLTSVYTKSRTPSRYIKAASFEHPEQMTLYVPVGAREAYAAADHWKDFGEIVEVEEFPSAGREAVIAGKGGAVRVYGATGAVVIEADGTRYAIYTTDGREVASGIADGRTEVPLPQGIYVARTGSASHRIAVR